MRLGFSLSTAVLATTVRAAIPCSNIIHQHFNNNTSINFAIALPAGSNFTGNSVETSYDTPQVDLPEVCRVGFKVRTSEMEAEVWMPMGEEWEGRFLAVGNGGFAGGINYPDIVWGVRKGFATMSTNTGHDSSQGDGRWMLGHPEKMIDFGHRALHETTVAAKRIVELYYGEEAAWSYYAGCSTGGRQGLAASQRYPDDYGGILVGSAIASQTNTSAWQDWVALEQFPNNRSSYIPAEMWPIIHKVVLEQCDHLDGVKDSIIMDPTTCHPDFSSLLCNVTSTNSTTCLNPDQLTNLHRLYAGWPAISHPGLSPGGEASFSYLMNSVTPQFGPSFYRYAVFNDSEWDWSTLTASDVAFANEMNPGGMNAYNPDLRPFQAAGGKLLQHHGWADPLIPSLTAPKLYSDVNASIGDVEDFYRLFMVPGMGHCSGWVLDAAGQSGITPPTNNTGNENSMLWSLVDWVENGKAVEEVVGTKYVNDTARLGVEFQRPVCKWPGVAEYIGGEVGEVGSWRCP